MDSSNSERFSQHLMEGSQDWSQWLGSSQETPQRSTGVVVRPTVVSWSHAANRGGGTRAPPSHTSLQQMPHIPAPLPDPRDVTLARDIRVGLHTILSVMSSVPEQLKEVAAEVGRASLQQQQYPQHHEETRRVVRDTGDALQALLTGLQDTVTQLQQGQNEAATLQKEVMKKHEEQMEEIIKKMEQLGWRQGEGKEGGEEKDKGEKDEEEEERARRERARLEEVLAETKKELRRQVRRLRAAAAGRTASVERAVDGLQEGVSRVCGSLEEVKGLVMQPPPRSDDNNNEDNNDSPLAASFRQLHDSTRDGFQKVESSIESLKQVVSGMPSHLTEELNQAVREAFQQHPIIISTTANSTPNSSNNNSVHNPNTSISVSPIQRTFSAHRPVLPLNESFSLCLSSPVAHVSPITQVSPSGTMTTTTTTASTTASTTTASTRNPSSSSSHQHQHQHGGQAYDGSMSRQPQSGQSQRPAPTPQHPSSRSHPPPSPPPSKRSTGHSSDNSRPSHSQQSVNCTGTILTRKVQRKPLPTQQQQQHRQQLLPISPPNPHHSNARPSHANNPLLRPVHPQRNNPKPPYPQYLGPRPPHPQYPASRPSCPQQTRPEVSNSQQTHAMHIHTQQTSFKPPQPQQQMRPKCPSQQVRSSTVPRPQQASNVSGKAPKDPQRISIKVSTSQHSVALQQRPPEQEKTRHSPTTKIGINMTQQPSQHAAAPPPQQQHQQHKAPPPQTSASKEHQTQQDSKIPPRHMSLRPMPHRRFPQHERPSFPPLQHIRVKKTSKQQKQQHIPPPSSQLPNIPQNSQHNPPQPSQPPSYIDSSIPQHSQHNPLHPPQPPSYIDSSIPQCSQPSSHVDSNNPHHSQHNLPPSSQSYSHAALSITQHSQHHSHHHPNAHPSSQQQHSSTRSTQTQNGIIHKTTVSRPLSQQLAQPSPMPPPLPPPKHHVAKTLTQHQDFPPQHHHHNYYTSPARRNSTIMATSTPKSTNIASASSTPQQQQQTPTTTGNYLNVTASPWLHNDSGLNWSQKSSACDPFCNDLSGDSIFVDHEEVVTSCEEGRPVEKQDTSAFGGGNRNSNVGSISPGDAGYMQNNGNIDSIGNSSDDVVDFSAINTNVLEMTGTQHFTPQNTTSLGQVISPDGKDTHMQIYDSSSSDESPSPSTSMLASLGVPPPPPPPAPLSAVSGSEWMMSGKEHQGNTSGKSLYKPPINTQLIQHHQDTTHYASSASRGAAQHEVRPTKSREVAVAAVAPSTLVPSVRRETTTPSVRRTPWRIMVPPEGRPVGRTKGKSKEISGIHETIMNPTHAPAVHQLAPSSTAFPRAIPNMKLPVAAPHNSEASHGDFSFQNSVGGMKRKHEEERKEERVGVKRFLVPFPTPKPKLILFHSSKGQLRASLAETV